MLISQSMLQTNSNECKVFECLSSKLRVKEARISILDILACNGVINWQKKNSSKDKFE